MDGNRLKNIVQQLGLDVPVLKVKEEGRRICLYLYGGGLVELENEQGKPAPSTPAADMAEGQATQTRPQGSAPVPAKRPVARRKKDGHD